MSVLSFLNFVEAMNFLTRLRQVLSNPDENDNCIVWVHDGRAIQIINEKKLLKVFPYCNFNAFVRQLNLYGFQKTQRNLNERIYFHPLYRQHQPELATRIKRKPRRQRLQVESNMPYLPSIKQVLKSLRGSR